MNTKTHPMLVIASIAVVLFCGIGVAAIMGWIPTSMGHNAELAEAPKPAAPPATPLSVPPKQHKAVTHAEHRIQCDNCGVVQSVRSIESEGRGSGLGAVGGAVVGGLLGNQVGGGRGKDAATVVGVVGGAVAGNQIEKRSRSTTSYEISVRMNDGSTRSISQSSAPGWRPGDHVKIVDGMLQSAS